MKLPKAAAGIVLMLIIVALPKWVPPAEGEFGFQTTYRVMAHKGSESKERIALIYIDTAYKVRNVQDYKKIIAHMTSDGKFDDLFFNTILFLGIRGREGNFEVGTASQSDWDWWLGLILGQEGEASFLERAAIEISSELPLDHVGVILMIPRPRSGALQARMDSVKNYVEKAEVMFESGHYSKLKLKGFYWMSESAEEEDVELIRQVSAFLHSKGYTFYWIPYFNARGYDDWKQLGFDKVMLQPNFAFYDCGLERFEEVDRRRKLYNFSVEMELPSYKQNPRVEDWKESFLLYLWASIKYDWGDLPYVSYYYKNDFIKMASDAATKKFYDFVYLHVRGKLTSTLHPAEIDQAYERFQSKAQRSKTLFALILAVWVLFVAIIVLVIGKQIFRPARIN